MNIFSEYGGYYGKNETDIVSQAARELISLAATVRGKLGERGGLLSEYYCGLLETVGAVPLYTAAEAGFNSGTELRSLCKSIAKGKLDHAEHPLYERVKEHIAAHPYPCLAVYARQSLYFAGLSDSFAEYAVEKYAHKSREAKNSAISIVNTSDLYREICNLLGGEEDMERFNLLFRQRFLGVSMISGFLQGLTDNVIAELISRDAETSQPIARLWLEKCL